MSWRVGDASPRRILTTDEMLFGCKMAGTEFVCAREGATKPRHLVVVEPSTLQVRVVHQPNETLRTNDFGEVTRLRFRNNEDIESYADLVLPRSRRPGEKFPLVIVGYRSDGFLRGGTGDEVPIHPLVNRGIAVLSFHRPFLASVDREARTEKDLLEGNRKNWRDRRSVQSALETAVQMAVETGHIDRERLGITGFSDGAATAQWALINTDMFKAASLSSLGEDKFSYFLQAGPEFTDRMRNAGYKVLEEDGEGFWEPYSLINNVDHVDVPMLIQVPDTEYEGGLDIFEVYSHAGKAIEMYVFEDEAHVKWQPAHRLAVYQRNVEWFEFWLAGRKNCGPDRAAQYERWTAMAGAPTADQLVCASTK
jgi:dipeptidyl aminopeptidase/acylaminoacyl peptidase